MPNHIMCIGWPTIKRLAAGESVWFEDLQCGAVAADDLHGADVDGMIAARVGEYDERIWLERVGKAEAEVEKLRSQLVLAKAVIGWVDSWVSHPVGSYSVYALDGLFGMTRDKIAALSDEWKHDMSEEGKAKAALAYLLDTLVYSDSYGIPGSEFHCCFLCSGGGSPNAPFKHDEECPALKCEAVGEQWWLEHQEEIKEIEAELVNETERADLFANSVLVPQWRPIETAPHEERVLLGWMYDGAWFCETGMASHGWRRNGISNMSRHGHATHWQPLPAPLSLPDEQGKSDV